MSEGQRQDYRVKIYTAMIWVDDPKELRQRVSVLAENLDDARTQLEAKYGKGHVFNLRNEEDASRPR